MSNTAIKPFEKIQERLLSKSSLRQLSAIFGSDRAKPYVASVLNEIRRSACDSKKDLTVCTPESIFIAVRDAAKLRLEIDGRQHAHLVKRGNKAILQIGYRGYLARLQDKLPGFTAHVECVYKGDEITVVQEGSRATVTHRQGDPFGARKDDDIIGVYAVIAYDAGTERVSYVTTMNRAEILKVQASAEMMAIWKAWFSEKAKVACIRRACKMHFSAITHDLDQADNANFELDIAAGREKAESINSRLSEEITDIIDVTPQESE